ncbi:YiiX/YebB-like N1pC/P60 family cysteine hydrolase [Thiobacillus sp.]|uniref:YiiX/YebB-like N1pC/P60 family cysteine hydrolase n=1 Tax=Thiobacillus sp. TaxID=924 RepID=UPI0011D549B8|nr:YiiX/YebB-like N1pC/P60 family cysteine hydrolase [Thiobacillus sp.]TXH73997.1 MAG: lipo-like protein [Thiobacillus sp.]
MNTHRRWLGRWLASYLNRPLRNYKPYAPIDTESILALLQPGDVLLVEGNTRVSTAVKYLTQSTWSHAALYVGDALGHGLDAENAPTLIEADLARGVIAVPLATYANFNIRICRPLNLDPVARERVVHYAINRLGHTYDLKNIIDLGRYLLPIPLVPSFMRRRMLSLGSGDPTRAICSTLIAQAFQSVRYPILPCVEILDEAERQRYDYSVSEIHHIRHHSLFAPRDFDLSPYFKVIKPLQELDFDYTALQWQDRLMYAQERASQTSGEHEWTQK